MKRSLIFLFIFFLVGITIVRWPKQCLANTHPYLLFNETEISSLKSKLGNEPFSSAFNHLTDGNDWQSVLLGLSLKFLLTDNRVYSQQAAVLLNSALSNPELDPDTTSAYLWDSGGWVRTYALVYDWLYNELEQSHPVVLNNLQQELERWVDKISGLLYLTSGSGVHARNNAAITAYGGLGLALLSLENEVILDSQLLIKVKQKIKTDAFSLAGPKGQYQEGFHYQAFGLPKALTFAVAYQKVKGEDIISNTSLEKITDWFIYSQTSGNGLLSYADPGKIKQISIFQGEYLFLINKNQDSVGKWFWQKAHPSGWRNNPPFYDEFYYPAIILWYPKNLAITSPWTANYSQSAFFTEYLPSSAGNRQAGLVILRNGFENDSLVFSFMNRFTYQPHQHYDPLSFTLSAYGQDLGIDSMVHTYQQPDRGANHEHNLVVIDLADWSLINAGNNNTGMAFYGKHSSQLGFITKFFTDLSFDFTKGDGRYPYADISKNKFGEVTSEYEQIELEEITPINKAFRSIMFIKNSEHPYFIINDDIQKDESFHSFSWLFHTGFTNISGQGGINSPFSINTGSQSLKIWFFSPQGFSSRVVNYLNSHNVIEVEKTNVLNPYFSALLYPKKPGQPMPIVSQEIGQLIVGKIVWPEAVDYVLFNKQAGVLSSVGQFTTDSQNAWLHFVNDMPSQYFAEDVNLLKKGDAELIKINNGKKANVFYDGAKIKIKGTNFSGGVFLAPNVNQVFLNSQPVEFSQTGNYVFVLSSPPNYTYKEIISSYGSSDPGKDLNSDNIVNGFDFGLL